MRGSCLCIFFEGTVEYVNYMVVDIVDRWQVDVQIVVQSYRAYRVSMVETIGRSLSMSI